MQIILCLLAPSISAMQTLLDVRYDSGSYKDILLSSIKSVCAIFKPKGHKLYFPLVFVFCSDA